MRYTVSTKDGRVLSEHRTSRPALQAARQVTLQEGKLTINQFDTKTSKIGRPVAYVEFSGEWNSRNEPLEFWSNGHPVLA